MATPKKLLPDCGLFRTTKPLPEHEAEVPAGVLVYFHNHSDSGLPVVIVPDHNVHNRWHFHGAGIPFRGLSWADSLVQLPAEGFYMLRKALTFDGGEWPKAALVQLGYTQVGRPDPLHRAGARDARRRTTSSSATAASASRASSSPSSSPRRSSPSRPPKAPTPRGCTSECVSGSRARLRTASRLVQARARAGRAGRRPARGASAA